MSPASSAQSTFGRFPARLQEAIVSRLGWTSLRPVQELAGQAILDGHNAVVLAPTAGGKTEASVFPVLAHLMSRRDAGLGAIYVAPIKALLNNQADRLGMYTEMVGLRRFLWHGDVTASERRKFLKSPSEILMTTPESLEVMLLSGKVNHAELFARVQAVVIDEVHALAGKDRGTHLMSVLERIGRYSEHDICRVGLSATVGNPDDILHWLQGSSKRPGVVIDPPQKSGPKELSIRYLPTEEAVAEEACKMATGQKSLFFCQSRAVTETVADRLRGREVDVFVHHSSVALEERQAAEARFHHGKNAMIACTSTLELGIDVGDLDRVLQAEAPSTVSSFMQRMGRTGRRPGTVANTVFFCQSPENVLQAAAIIELAKERWVESVSVTHRCWPVLVHQILALCLQYGAVSSEKSWAQLQLVPDFSGIEEAEFLELIDYMVAEDFLFSSGGLLALGDRAERVFGRRNFMEIYAVFSSPQLYRVITDTEKEIGSLDQEFVDVLVEDMSCFLLGGRPWLVKNVNHEERKLRVETAPAGRKPKWGDLVPQFLGYEICQKMAEIITSDADLTYLSDAADQCLQLQRNEKGKLFDKSSLSLESFEDKEMLWTFAGGFVNQTIRHGLSVLYDWEVGANSFTVTIKRTMGEGVPTVFQALERLANPTTWQDPEFRRRLLLAMPQYRLSKFQAALPPHRSLEMVQDYLLDIPRTLEFLSQQLGRDSKPEEISEHLVRQRIPEYTTEKREETQTWILPDPPSSTALPVLDLENWSGDEPSVLGWVSTSELPASNSYLPNRDFLASLPGRAFDRLYGLNTLGVFRKPSRDDELPSRDELTVVRHDSLRDPDWGQTTIRRFGWSERTDANGKALHVKLELRPRAEDRYRYRTQYLEIPTEEWEDWQPYGVLVSTMERPK